MCCKGGGVNEKKMISFIVVCSFLVTVLPLTASADGEGSVGETLTIPTVSDVLEQVGTTGNAAYESSVNFWNDYGNNISDGIGQAGESWNSVKALPGFETTYGDAVKAGDGILRLPVPFPILWILLRQFIS